MLVGYDLYIRDRVNMNKDSLKGAAQVGMVQDLTYQRSPPALTLHGHKNQPLLKSSNDLREPSCLDLKERGRDGISNISCTGLYVVALFLYVALFPRCYYSYNLLLLASLAD